MVHARFALFAAALVLTGGCSFILNPENSDDVVRCSNPTDCEEDPAFSELLSDNRFDPVCSGAGGVGTDISETAKDLVCSVTFTDIGCDPMSKSAGHPLFDTYTMAIAQDQVYVACSSEEFGLAGCPPGPMGCNNGAAPEDFGGMVICPDPSSAFPAYPPNLLEEPAGQDVLDQYCQSFFCDDTFVCDRSGGNPRCKVCDPGKPVGQGGCGVLYVHGARSTVYLDDASSSCATSDAGDPSAAVSFGQVVPSPGS